MWFLRVFWGWLIRNCFPNRVGGLKYWTEGVIKSSLSWISFIDHFPLFFSSFVFSRLLIYLDYLYCINWCEFDIWNFGNGWIRCRKIFNFAPSRIYFGFHFEFSLRIPNFLIGRSFPQERRKFWFWWIGTCKQRKSVKNWGKFEF